MKNIEIALVFYEIADLLEIKGGNFFQVRAYRQAAQVITRQEQPVEKLIKEGKFQQLPGIGKAIYEKTKELLETGKCSAHQALLAEIPRGMLEIRSLPGIGPAKARTLLKEGYTSLEQLAQAAAAHRLRKLPGFSAKTEHDILRDIDLLKSSRDQIGLGVARELGEELIDYLSQLPTVVRVELAGGTRRWKETVSDLDLVACASDIAEVLEAFAIHPKVTKILHRGDNRLQVMTWWGVEVDLTVTPPEQFVSTWHRCTGSKRHYQQLQQIAEQRGLSLNHRQLLNEAGEILPLTGEQDIYKHLGMEYIPPELREGKGEIEAALADKLPPLITLDDIKGDLHTHTNWSDAALSLEEMVEHAVAKGYRYMAITDHSRSLKIANGLSLERLRKQGKEIDKLNAQLKDFTILKGIECDILPDGTLDFEDEVLRDLDVVVASVHSNFKQEKEAMTNRIVSAIRNEHVDIIGHVTGRMLGRRSGYQLDLDRVLEEAAKHETVLEINSSPDRLDLNEENARKAKELGIKISINTDAHDLKRLNEMVYGISVARRAWLTPDDVINTHEVEDILKIFN